jgi:hypothetical protein
MRGGIGEKIMAARENVPAVTEKSMTAYKELRQDVHSALKNAVLPGIIKALKAQQALDDALATDPNLIFDTGDRALLLIYHPKSLPVGVKLTLNRMKTKMTAVLQEAIDTDTALIAAGEKPFFNVELPLVVIP